jgi:4-alpha-glucanotransferase
MNLPGTEGDNWHWRLARGALTSRHARVLAELVDDTQRH